MRWRNTVVLGAAMMISSGCGLIGGDDSEVQALAGAAAVDAGTAEDAAVDPVTSTTAPGIVQIEVDDPTGDGAAAASDQTAAPESSTTSTTVNTAAEASSTTEGLAPATSETTAAPTTAAPTTAAPTTAAPTTAAPTTAAPTTAAPTTAAPTTAAPTTAAPSGETRAELVALGGLSTFGGGTLNADDYAGRNVVLWFWGAH